MEKASSRPLRIVIITSQDPTTDWMRQSLQELNYKVVGVVESVYQALQLLEKAPADIVLADSAAQTVLETSWIQNLAVQSMGTTVIVVAANSEMEFVQQAMLAGAQGFLLKPFDLAHLHASVQQVHQLSLQRKAALAEVGVSPDIASAASNKAYSMAVFSPKGGAGATTLAVNLAIALHQQTKSPVLLVDADLRTADVDIFLSILSKYSIYSMLDLGSRIDEELLERVLAKHASGISVLRGEPQLQLEIPIEAGQMSDLIEGLSSLWPGYIVFNTGDGLDRWTVEILDAVDTVLVVTTPELPSLRATRSFLELADAAADQSNKWQLIMSSYQGKKVLRIADIEASIQYRIKATIAEDIAAVSTCINRGTPLILSHRKSPVAQDILSLAKQLAEATAKLRRPQGAPSAAGPHGVHEEAIGHSEPGKGSSFWHSFTNSARIPAG